MYNPLKKIINYQIFTDGDYAEKAIVNSLYSNKYHLIILLKISEIIIKKKIKKLLISDEYNFNLINLYDSLGRNLWYQGKNYLSIECFSKQEECIIKIREYIIKKKNLDKKKNIYYLPRNTIDVFGLLGHLDFIIKFFKLRNINFKLVILIEEKNIVNKYYFYLFDKYIEFIEIRNCTEEQLLEEKIYFKNFHWIMPSMIESKNQICHKTFSEVDLEWKSKKLEPIIKVPNTDNEELIKIKNFFNISNGSKYICLNIRSTKYSKYNKFADSFRNGEIKDYESTINYLTELGYYVILLGENIEESHFNYSKPNMLINYSSCPIKSDKNDILIINNCELFIAAASGPQVIANSLNKKICFINAPFYNGFPCYKDSIFLPLKYYKNNKIVKIEEILKKYTNCFFKHMFDLNNLKIKKCSSNEILLTVKEFLFDNNIIKNFELLNNKNVNLFRKEFDVYNNKYNTKIYSKISAAYIVENYL